MNYSVIKTHDIANGVGVRVSLFVSGCPHHCRGCFNEETWDYSYGEPFTAETEQEILRLLEPSWVNGLSILGGEPLALANRAAVTALVKAVREALPEKTVWCYTGYLWEEIRELPVVEHLDVVVDGRFVEALKDISLRFRGSQNQRVIDVQKSREAGKVILWNES